MSDIDAHNSITPGSFRAITRRVVSRSGKEKIIPAIPLTQEVINQIPQGDVSKALASAVRIMMGSNITFGREEMFMLSGCFGSGFCISPDGGILTNKHVTDVGSIAKARFILGESGGIVKASVIHSSPEFDMALLKAEKKEDSYPVVRFANKDSEVSDYVHSLGINGLKSGQVIEYEKGNPLAKLMLYFKRFKDDVKTKLMAEGGLVVTSLPLTSGDSGSGIVNDSGEVVGITNLGLKNDNNFFNRILFTILDLKSRIINQDFPPPKQRLEVPVRGYGSFSPLKRINGFLQQIGLSLDDIRDGKPIQSSNYVHSQIEKSKN